jgi:hypothetical protein
MAWIKRNLFFVIGSIVALGLLGAAGFYDYKSWQRNSAAFENLNEIYGDLKSVGGKKPSPGNDKVNNTQAARDQEKQLREWIKKAREHFQPVAPIPSPANGPVSSEAFASAMRKTIDQLQHEAAGASVIVPPQYGFSFEAQRSLVRFAPNGLEPLSAQLGEVKAISEIIFAARVNQLDGVQRRRVSDDDTAGPASDYIDDQPVTTDLAVLTPYEVTFRAFTPEIAQVLAAFAASPHGFIVKAINVQPAAAAADATQTPAATTPAPGMMPGKGGLQTILNEQLLRVTLLVEVVKLSPGN